MEARVDEIAPQIFRIAVWTGKAPITFNQFVIRDEFPALIHTGHAALFDTVRAQVERLLDPRTLRYISFSHFEADECGALNHWLTLAPQNKVSGGRLLSAKTQPSANRAAGILRLSALSLGRTETALGAFYRRLAYRVGKAKAITATARKLAILVYRTLKDGLRYQDPGAAAYTAHHRARVLRHLRQRAATLGFALVTRDTGEVLEGTVS